MRPLLALLSERPTKDLWTSTFAVMGSSATVFRCGGWIVSGCNPADYPFVVVVGQDWPSQCSAYRVVGFSADADRETIEMSLEGIEWIGAEALRRSIRIGRAIG